MNKIASLFDRRSNNAKLLLMLVLAYVVLCVATGGKFFSLNQARLVAYLFPEMGILSLGVMLCMIAGGIDLTV
ncbi:MAG: ABC transporter permease, partial [Lachnospiraceae bacterium]|nr:ABC transporter permease [Lachnospiraceae bacterium]